MRNILVTGATQGIGLAITEKLLAEDSKIFGVYKEREDLASEMEKKYKDRVEMLEFDLSKPEKINELILRLKDIKFDGIVNNAGICYLTKWENLDFNEWDETLAVNLTAPLRIVHGLRNNLNDGSAIVNIASVDGNCAAFDTVAYAVSKAGLINLTKSLAAILGPRNIRVNAVAPGWVITEMTKDSMPEESKEITPLKRNAKPEEVANVVSFLLREESSFVSGTTINIDGGLTVVDYTLYKESGK